MQMTTGLVKMRTKEQSGQTARQRAIAQRARAPTNSSTASIAVLINAAGASAILSPAAATTAWNGDGAAAEAVDMRVL